MKKLSKRGSVPPAKPPAAVATEAPAAVETTQRRLFEEAMRAFHSRDFAHAKPLFEQCAAGANREMAHSARLHVRMCEHRISSGQPALESAEDRYTFAIALINRGEYAAAESHLQRALDQAADADHLHYALALCRGRQGDIDGAHRHLKRAIELQPRNRSQARTDADFADLIRHPPIAELLFPNRARS